MTAASLDQTRGSMTGLFHMFEGHPALTSRHYSTHSGLRTQAESQSLRHDRRNDLFSKTDDPPKNIVAQSQKKQHHRSHSDVVTGDFTTTPSRTLNPGLRPMKDARSGSVHVELEAAAPPAYSEGKVTDALAFYSNETLRAAALFAGDDRRVGRSDLDQFRANYNRTKRNVEAPKAGWLVDSDVPGSADIRDAILASFERLEVGRPISDQSSCLNNNQGEPLRSVRRDGLTQKDRKGVDLPRSLSVSARPHGPSEVVDWKEGLRSSTSPHRKLSHHNSPERRVEPKKDVRTGRYSPSKDHYPKFASMSPKRYPGSQNLECNNFKESPGASDFRESLKPFLTGTRAHRERRNGRSFGASRSGGNSSEGNLEQVGVSHQMPSREVESLDEHSVVPNVIARLMGLEKNGPSSKQDVPSSRDPDHSKSRGGRFFRGLVQFDPQNNMRAVTLSPPPPPPSQSKKLHIVHHLDSKPESDAYYRKYECNRQEGAYQGNYPAQYKMEHELCSCEEDRDYEHFDSNRPFLPFEDESHQAEGQAHPVSGVHQLGYPPAPQFTDSDTNTVAPGKKKKMIRKILEAMRPKVLRKSSSHRKQTELISPDLTKLMMISNDVQPVQDQLGLEKQQPSTLVKVVAGGLKFPNDSTETEDQPPRRVTTSVSDTSSVKQVQEEQSVTEYSTNGTSESSVAKPQCVSEPAVTEIVVMKPTTRSHKSHADSAGTTSHVNTASSTSADKEVLPTRPRTAQARNYGDKNLAKDQRRETKPVTPRVRAKCTLESDYESDPSSVTTRNDKSIYGVRESRTMAQTTTRSRNPSSKSLTPDNKLPQRQQSGRYLTSPDSRPSPRSSPSSKAREVDHRKSVDVAKTKKGTNPKAQLAKEEITFEKRLTEKPDNSSESRALEKLASKGAFPSRSKSGPARARSPAAPRRVTDVTNSRSSPTTDAITVGTESHQGSNSALQLRPVLPVSTSEGSEPVLETVVSVQSEPGRSKDSRVHRRHTPPEGDESVGDHCSRTDPEFCESLAECRVVIPDEAQPLVQVEELATIIEVSSEELRTPLCVPFKHCENLNSKLDVGLDRPSPVSVLDANTFDSEELTPSPSSPKHVSKFSVLQDSESKYIDKGFEISCGKMLSEAYNERLSPRALVEDKILDFDSDGLFSKCAERLRAQIESIDAKHRLDKFQSFFKEYAESQSLGQESLAFVERLLNFAPKPLATSPVLTTGNHNVISEKLLESLQSNRMLQKDNHKLLLDCLEEIMERILESKSSSLMALIPESVQIFIQCTESRSTAAKQQQLEQALWVEVQDAKLRNAADPPEDICDTVHKLLHRDFIRCQGRQWSSFVKDREELGIDMEQMIVQDMVEEAVKDFCALHHSRHKVRVNIN